MELTTKKIVSYLLALLALIIMINIFQAPIRQGLNSLATVVVNVLTPYGKPVAFTDLGKRDPALDSVNGLLYGVNVVSGVDTKTHGQPFNYKSLDFYGLGYDELEKRFGDRVVVKPTYIDSELIDMGGAKTSDALLQVTKNLVQCRIIFIDKGEENTNCFTYDFSKYKGDTITKDKLSESLKSYKETGECQKDDSCVSAVNDILGVGAFDVKSLDMREDISHQATIYICAKSLAVIGTNEFVISTAENACNAKISPQQFGVKVMNFSLTQKYPALSGNPSLQVIENLLKANGDPDYVIYYEQFPQGEDQYWQLSAYEVDIMEIIITNGIFAAIDLIPAGKILGGKVLRSVLGEAGEAAIKEFFIGIKTMIEKTRPVTWFNAVKNSIGESMGNLLKKIFTKPLQEISEKILLTISEKIEQAQVRVFEKIFASDSVRAISKSEIKVIVTSSKHVFTAAEEKAMNEFLETTFQETAEGFEGRIFKEGSGEFEEAFRVQLKKKLESKLLGASGDMPVTIASEIAEKTIRELEESVLRDAGEAGVQRALAWAYKSVTGANAKLAEKLAFITDTMPLSKRKEVIEKMLQESDDYLTAMSSSEFQQFTRYQKKNAQLVMEMQTTDIDYLAKMIGKTKGQVGRMTETERKMALAAKFDTILKDVPLQENAFRRAKTFAALVDPQLEKSVVTQRLLTVSALVINNRIQSMNEKFVPVGTNAIGVRTPYMATYVYDDSLNTNIKDMKKFFQYYGGYVDGKYNENFSRNRGLIPDVNRYYLDLAKDKFAFIGTQQDQRFHLVSPCAADIYIKATKCECYSGPKPDTTGKYSNPVAAAIFEREGVYETGVYNPKIDRTVSNFDGSNKMLYTIGENGFIVKECYQENILQEVNPFNQPTYEPTCLEINPVLDDSTKPNYCYKGAIPAGVKTVELGLLYGLPIAGSLGGASAAVAACAVPPLTVFEPICAPVGSALGGFLTGVAGSVAYATIISPRVAWPNHDFEWTIEQQNEFDGAAP